MKSINRYRKFFVIGGFYLLSQLLWPQQETDSSLIYANKQIYENPDKAIEIAFETFNSPDATTDFKVRALIVVSTAYSSKREYEKSLEYSLKALGMLPKIRDTNLKVKLLNRIGGQYQELGVYDKAVVYLDKALVLIEELPKGEAKYRGLGTNYLLRGFIYREQMSCDIALKYFNSAIEAYTLSNVNSNMSTAYYNRGNCLLTMDRKKDAEHSFIEAIAYAKKTNAKSLVAFAQKGLARVYTTEGNNHKAIALLKDALQNSEEVGDKVLNRAIYYALANNYLAVNDLKNYSLYQHKNLSIHNEIIKTERKTIDNSIQNLMKENSQKIGEFQRRINFFLFTFIILIIVVIIVWARTIRNSEKTLKSLKEELEF